jgi:undecaprenyl-diphosphatase
VLAPVGRRLAGPARFAWHRLTPGELGLELTTLLAVALVGGFVFGGAASLVVHHHHFTGDATAFRLAHDLRTDTAIDVVKVVTWLGSLPVMAGIVLLSAAYLGTRRRTAEALALVAGGTLTWAGVQIAKAAIDRPRPTGALVDTAGAAYPSGHAAYSVAFVAVAVALSRAIPGFLYRAALVTGAVVLSGIVGWSRVYLRAHFFSDVYGGWGLAAGVFATCALVALVVAFFRHNGAAGDGPSP